MEEKRDIIKKRILNELERFPHSVSDEFNAAFDSLPTGLDLSLIHISEPTRQAEMS